MANKIKNKEEALRVVRELFKEWNKALRTGESEIVAKLYTGSNMFLPTLSGDFKFGREGDIEYFDHFLIKNPEGKIIEDDVKVGEKFIIHAGLYDFEVDNEQGGRDTVEARFTFVYEIEDDGVWRIAHHHSSLKPVNI